MTIKPQFGFDQLARRYDPAFRVAEAFGGFNQMARMLGVEASTVMRWAQAREVGGTGGVIPRWRWDAILKLAKAREINVNRKILTQNPAIRARPRVKPL